MRAYPQDQELVRKHIAKRAAVLGLTNLLPQDWVEEGVSPLTKKEEARLLKGLLEIRNKLRGDKPC